MKSFVCIGLVVAMAGCTSTAITERLDNLENSVASAQRTADQALETARAAEAKASGGASSVADAQRLAREAMSKAEETAERLRRMESECCGSK